MASAPLLLAQVIALDVFLSGDNAVVIGVAAAGLPGRMRNGAIAMGMGGAILARLALSVVALQALAYHGVGFVGGLMLFWVAWKMWVDSEGGDLVESNTTMLSAVLQITIADITMSLDNVLAVAAAAEGHAKIMVFGLICSMVMMTIAAKAVSDITQRFTWMKYIGMALVVYIALQMVLSNGYHLVTNT